MDQHNENISELVESLRQKEAMANAILGITSARRTAEAYKNDADQQEKRADQWQIAGVVSLALTALTALILPIYLGPGAGASWQDWLAFYALKGPFLGAFTALSVYALRQSSQHREREKDGRRLQNELTIFRPFIAELPEEEQAILVRQAVERYFPGHLLVEQPEGDERTNGGGTVTSVRVNGNATSARQARS
jgi:hypothetical protein